MDVEEITELVGHIKELLLIIIFVFAAVNIWSIKVSVASIDKRLAKKDSE